MQTFADNFSLNTFIFGEGMNILCIGSHLYYPRTFSSNITKNFRFICCDTRGFAKNDSSQMDCDVSIHRLINDVDVITRSLNLEKFILLGHSIHAFIALEYAAIHSDRVSHLILVGSSPIVGSNIYEESDKYFESLASSERKLAFQNSMATFSQNTNPSFADRMIAFGPKLWFDHNFDATDLWKNVEINTVAASVIWGEMFENYDTKKSLGLFKKPIFLALGKHDYFNPPHLWNEYKDYATDMTVHIFENSGHTPQLEESSKFDMTLFEWITKG